MRDFNNEKKTTKDEETTKNEKEIKNIEEKIKNININFYKEIIDKLEETKIKLNNEINNKNRIINETKENIFSLTLITSIFITITFSFSLLIFNSNLILLGLITSLMGILTSKHMITDLIKNIKLKKTSEKELNDIKIKLETIKDNINKNNKLLNDIIEHKVDTVKKIKQEVFCFGKRDYKDKILELRNYLEKYYELLNKRNEKLNEYKSGNLSLEILDTLEKYDLLKLKKYIKDSIVKTKTLTRKNKEK